MEDIPVRNSLRRAPWSIPYSPMKETTNGFFGEACFCLDHCFIPLSYKSSLVTLMLNVLDRSTFCSSDMSRSDTLHNHIKTILLTIQVHKTSIRSHKLNTLLRTCCRCPHGCPHRDLHAFHLCPCNDIVIIIILNVFKSITWIHQLSKLKTVLGKFK